MDLRKLPIQDREYINRITNQQKREMVLGAYAILADTHGYPNEDISEEAKNFFIDGYVHGVWHQKEKPIL